MVAIVRLFGCDEASKHISMNYIRSSNYPILSRLLNNGKEVGTDLESKSSISGSRFNGGSPVYLYPVACERT
jgi:hypothetical protein